METVQISHQGFATMLESSRRLGSGIPARRREYGPTTYPTLSRILPLPAGPNGANHGTVTAGIERLRSYLDLSASVSWQIETGLCELAYEPKAGDRTVQNTRSPISDSVLVNLASVVAER